MEINITKFFNHCQHGAMQYSASIAEVGENAGPSTWSAANEASSEFNLLDTEGKRTAFRKHISAFGAWSDEEIAAWPDTELNALFLQLIAGDMREGDLDCNEPDWVEFEELSQAGQCGGNIFRADNGETYYQLED